MSTPRVKFVPVCIYVCFSLPLCVSMYKPVSVHVSVYVWVCVCVYVSVFCISTWLWSLSKIRSICSHGLVVWKERQTEKQTDLGSNCLIEIVQTLLIWTKKEPECYSILVIALPRGLHGSCGPRMGPKPPLLSERGRDLVCLEDPSGAAQCSLCWMVWDTVGREDWGWGCCSSVAGWVWALVWIR